VLKPIRFRRRRPFLDAISRTGNGPGVDDRWHGQVETHPQIYCASCSILEGIYLFSITYTKTQ
jgi:hypothetical protein